METMTITTIAAPAGPQALLSYLLLHGRGDAAGLATALRHDGEQTALALRRMARRGLVTEQDGQFTVTPAHRAAVADYAEGAISLRELVGAR